MQPVREVASKHCFDKSGWCDLPDNGKAQL